MKLFVILIALVCATKADRADDLSTLLPTTSFDQLLKIFDKIFGPIMDIIGKVTGMIPRKDQEVETAKAIDFLERVGEIEKYLNEVEKCDDDNEAACAIVVTLKNWPGFQKYLAETLEAYQDEYQTLVEFAYRSAVWFSYKNDVRAEAFDVLNKIMDETERIIYTMESIKEAKITKVSSSEEEEEEESGSSESGFPEEY